MLTVLVCCIGLGLAWHLGQPAPRRWQVVFIGLVLALLLGMTLPSESIQTLLERVAPWSSQPEALARESSPWFHLVHFTLVSAWLWSWRMDLGAIRLGLGLTALSFATEGLQHLIEGRFASADDVLVNLLGVGLGWALVAGRRGFPYRRG